MGSMAISYGFAIQKSMTAPGSTLLPSSTVPAPPPHTPSGFFGEVRSLWAFMRRFARLAGPYWQSGNTWQEKLRIHGALAVLVLLTIAQVFMPIWTNQWNADFFNALEKKSWSDFVTQIGVMGAILLSSLCITSAHMWCKRRIQIGWRTWLTDRMLKDWMSEGHQQQVTYNRRHDNHRQDNRRQGNHGQDNRGQDNRGQDNRGQDNRGQGNRGQDNRGQDNRGQGKHGQDNRGQDNPDGRIAEDIRNVTEVTIELAHTLFYSSLLLIGFTSILWSLSGALAVEVAGFSFIVYGHLVWIALLYAAVFSSLALWVSRPLVVAAKERQAEEAGFRFELGRARENAETIALLRGEPNERRRFKRLFDEVILKWDAQSWALTKLLMFLSGYSVLSSAFPLLVAAPRYITGTLTLGALMQTAQAFQQMIQALSWPVDNSAKVAEWRGYGERVLGLHDALMNLHQHEIDPNSNIVMTEAARPVLAFHNLCVAMPDGRAILGRLHDEIQPGERVLLSGDSEAMSKLFRVIAGLWPWGCGRVELPPGEVMFFLPQKSYVPKGNLRAIVSYPTPSHGIEDARLINALKQVGLGSLAPHLNESTGLDKTTPWEQMLTRGELRRLGFARILLHKPRWVCIQEASDVLNPAEEQAMMRLLVQELPETAMLNVGCHTTLEPYHDRHIPLEHTKVGEALGGEGGTYCSVREA